MGARGANPDRCDCHAMHADIVAKVEKRMPDEERLFDLAELFKVFGDSTRVRIINALLHSRMCGCDLGALLGMSKSAISHQLRILRQSRLVKNSREGKVVFYSLDDGHVGAIFRQGLAHVSEGKR